MAERSVFTRSGLHSAMVFGLLFSALGAHLPFWPPWLESWGLSSAEVGTFMAATMVVRVIAGGAIPVIADRLDARRVTLAVVAGIGAVIFISHLWIESRVILFIATLASGIVYAGMVPLSDALGSASAKHDRFPYAQARAFGSLTFVLTNLAVGSLIGRLGPDVVVWWITISLLLAVFFAVTHPGGGKVKEEPPRLKEIGRLMRHPIFVLFVLAIAFAQSSHAVLYAYGSIHWLSLGISEEVVGQLWAFSVAVEVVIMFLLGTRMVAWLGPIGAIAASAIAGIIRWGAMMFDPVGPILWVLQLLHSGTFAVGHLGAIAFIAAAVQERMSATAQGIFGAAFGGVLMAVGTAAAAWAYPLFGGGAYAVALAMSALGLVFSVWLARRWNGEVLEA
ncbi:MAG: MFS transporter [Pseudomonadota bacterium]